MQRSDKAERLVALTKLAESKNAPVREGQMDTFLEDLADVPTPLLLAACVRLRKATTYGLPSSADVRLMCDDIQREDAAERAQKALRAAEEDRTTWKHCQRCQDDPGAWVQLYCLGVGAVKDPSAGVFERGQLGMETAFCGRSRDHGPHPFTERCTCHRASWREERRQRIATKFAEQRRERRSA